MIRDPALSRGTRDAAAFLLGVARHFVLRHLIAREHWRGGQARRSGSRRGAGRPRSPRADRDRAARHRGLPRNTEWWRCAS